MSDETVFTKPNQRTLLQLDERRKAKESKGLGDTHLVTVEVACQDEIGAAIRSYASAELQRTGLRIGSGNDAEKPDWILSFIAYQHGGLVELSVVLRRLFRSTAPGTEVENVDEDGQVTLRQGGWLYESLRFHGLFGVPEGHAVNVKVA